MVATATTNLAEEVIATIQLLSQSAPWKQMISLEIFKLLKMDLGQQLSEKVCFNFLC